MNYKHCATDSIRPPFPFPLTPFNPPTLPPSKANKIPRDEIEDLLSHSIFLEILLNSNIAVVSDMLKNLSKHCWEVLCQNIDTKRLHAMYDIHQKGETVYISWVFVHTRQLQLAMECSQVVCEKICRRNVAQWNLPNNTVNGERLVHFSKRLATLFFVMVNPLSLNSDKHTISPHKITTWSSIQLMRKREVINQRQKVLVMF